MPRANVNGVELEYAESGSGFPLIWCHEFAGGRSWYSALGHTEASYTEPLFRGLVRGGIFWAAGFEVGSLAGDANGDGAVDAADLSVLLGQFGQNVTPGSGADFNGDGVVNSADLSVLLTRFGVAC